MPKGTNQRMFISQVCPAPLYIMSYPGETSCTGLSGGHKELADLPLTSQEEGIQAQHVFVAPFPIRDTQTGALGNGGPCQEPAAAAVCCKSKHVCSCMCVCMGLDRESMK